MEYQSKGNIGRRQIQPDMFNPDPKRIKLDFDEDVVEVKCSFIRSNYTDAELPKTKLIALCHKNKYHKPLYVTINQDKLFRSVLTFNDKKYSSTYW